MANKRVTRTPGFTARQTHHLDHPPLPLLPQPHSLTAFPARTAHSRSPSHGGVAQAGRRCGGQGGRDCQSGGAAGSRGAAEEVTSNGIGKDGGVG